MQATLVEDDEMVQTFPADRANKALAICLVAEAARRQVIVFTHDLLFLRVLLTGTNIR